MPNVIQLAQKFQPILDELYRAESKTARMDSPTKPVNFGGANIVNIFTTSLVGLGNYTRDTGYPPGDVVAGWVPYTLTQERAREFSVDRMDDEETLGMAFGTVAGEFMRLHVAPEVDAYRFATYASTPNIQTVGAGVALTAQTVLAALDVAKAALNAQEVPEEGRILYVSDSVLGFIEAAISRTLSNENTVDRRVKRFDNMDVIMVPQGRFVTSILLDNGANPATGGFTKNVGGGAVDINFLMLHPSAVLQATKHANLKIFDPDTNQAMDSWKFQYRLYHDAFVYTNKTNGVYLHMSNV